MMNRSIVIAPVEKATDVARILRVATAIAASPADVHLVHVMKADGLWAMEQEERGPAPWPPDTEALAREGAAIRTVRMRGKAEAIIPAYAHLVGARAIIVERDFGTPRIWRNAAVVRRLSRSSPVPVLVLPAQGPALDRVARGGISRVVVAVDSSVRSAVALRTGVALARRHDARLTLLHAIKDVPGHLVFSGGEAWRVMQRLPAQERQVAGQLRQRAALLGAPDAQPQVVTGDAGPAIVSAASEADADLVVMGVAPRTALDQWAFGSTLGTVLRRARTPVLVVPVIGGAEQWDENTLDADAIRALAERSLTARAAA
jgi:nucleotide-binding universal stress UspA family protein